MAPHLPLVPGRPPPRVLPPGGALNEAWRAPAHEASEHPEGNCVVQQPEAEDEIGAESEDTVTTYVASSASE